jgi:hypothetical protein
MAVLLYLTCVSACCSGSSCLLQSRLWFLVAGHHTNQWCMAACFVDGCKGSLARAGIGPAEYTGHSLGGGGGSFMVGVDMGIGEFIS